MRIHLDGVERSGPAVDLRDATVDVEDVLAAARNPDDDRVCCGAAGELHERVGFLRRGVTISALGSVAAAARSRGRRSDHAAKLQAVRAELQEIDAPEVDLKAARECVATTAADVDALRERVARASGRVEALRDGNGAVEAAEADLAAATQELAAAETDYHAAREALAAAREQARGARDARERRLALEDRLANLRRDARRELAASVAGQFRLALHSLPVPGEPTDPTAFEGPDWAAACGVARIADCSAPLVVSDDIFQRPTRARATLDAPVVLVEV